MPVTSAGIAAVALVLAGTLYHFKVARMAILPLFLIAGAGITGMLGTLLGSIASALQTAVGTATAWAFGMAVPIILLIVMTVSLVVHARKGDGGKLAIGTALVFFPLCAIVGGPFGFIAGAATDLLASVGPAIADVFNSL